MINILSDLGDTNLSVAVLDYSSSPPALYLNVVQGAISVTCAAWDNIRTDQTAILLLDGVEIASQPIEPLDPDGENPNQGKAPIFPVDVKANFTAGNRYSLQIKSVDTAMNIGLSRTLVFDVKADSLEKHISIDITQGAAGYSDKYPYLMPADVAVVRGPAGLELEARSGGAVRFQDCGGAETCIFSFDDRGVCPLVLIRIDSLNPSGGPSGLLADDPDRIILFRRGKKDELISKPVIFGNYVPATGDAALAFDSVSCNSVGIADGQTMCIVSLIMKNPAATDTLYINLGEGLRMAEHTYNKSYSASPGTNLPSTPIVNGMAEFGVIADAPGTYDVAAFPRMQTSAYWTNKIEFRSLL